MVHGVPFTFNGARLYFFCCGLRTDKLVVFRQPESPRNQRRVCNVHRCDGYAVHHPRVELQRCFWLKKGGECVAEKKKKGEEEEERRRRRVISRRTI